MAKARQLGRWQSGTSNPGCQPGAHTEGARVPRSTTGTQEALLSRSRDSDGCLPFVVMHLRVNAVRACDLACAFINDIQVLLSFCILVIRLKLFHFQNQYGNFVDLPHPNHLVHTPSGCVHLAFETTDSEVGEPWVQTPALRLPPASRYLCLAPGEWG